MCAPPCPPLPPVSHRDVWHRVWNLPFLISNFSLKPLITLFVGSVFSLSVFLSL